ncbi:TIGR04372 family glycosyltransferase [Nisaea sp.]|uniref:TIGR04372 family glycosyltransferase n=1 Tax=Nisaea sp. TaxID=2024842 RepID=UPI0032973AF9
MEETPRDRVFREELADPERLKIHVGRLVELLNARLNSDKRYLVYVLAQQSRLGHLIAEPWCLNTMFRERYDEIVIVTGPGEQAANTAVFEYLKSEFTVVETDDIVLTTMGFIDAGAFGLGNYDLYLRSPQTLYKEFTKQLANGLPHRFFSAPEHVRESAKRFLTSSIENPSRPYVVLHVRDAGYAPEMDYHSFRFTPIEAYREGVRFLLDNGYAVVRIGDVASPALDLTDPNYIEAMRHEAHDRMLDFGLIGGAAFGICTQSGPFSMFQALGKPFLLTNAYPVSSWGFLPHELSIFTHYVRDDGGRLSYREMGYANLKGIATTGALEAAGLRVESNSGEEVLAGVKEMIRFVEEQIEPDLELQNRFLQITAEFDENVRGTATQGSTPLRWHQRLCSAYLELNPRFLM